MSDEATIPIIKTAQCPSLTARSTLTYEIGTHSSGPQIRIVDNTGNGHFTPLWTSLTEILEHLKTCKEPFTWQTLQTFFVGMSVNTAGFLMAALKHEGLVRTSGAKSRRYEYCDPKPFMDELTRLLNVSNVQKPPKKGAAKTPKKSNPEAGQSIAEDNSNQ